MNKGARKTILLFAYYWPPASGPGVQRWLKFAKFLPDNGFDVILVSPENGSYPNMDPSLSDEVPESVKIIRTQTLEPFRLFNILTGKAHRGKTTSVGMGDIKGSQSIVKKAAAYIRANWFIPDARKGWNRYAIKAGTKAIIEHEVDLIITTGPPHSSHLIGLSLSKKFPIPWIADLRDPWTNIYYNKFLPRSRKSIEKDRRLEEAVISNADAVTVVSHGLQQEFMARARRLEVIHNGYDEEDFEQLPQEAKAPLFRLSYIGNMKVNQNCTNLWKAVHELAEEIPDFKKTFRLSLTGNIHEEVLATLKEYGLSPLVEQLPFVEHAEAVRRMQTAGALLLLIPDSPNNAQIITGKIFEYLASQTPLVSIGPPKGDAAGILKQCHRSPMIAYSDPEQIKSRVHQLWASWMETNTPSDNLITDRTHTLYSRKVLTQKLAALCEEVINR